MSTLKNVAFKMASAINHPTVNIDYEMNLLHLIPYYIRANKTGGPSIFLSKLAGSISAFGTKTTIISTNGNLAEEIQLPFINDTCVVYEEGTEVIYLRRNKTILPPTYYYAPALQGWLENHVHEYDLVIVHGIWTYFNWVARHVCQKARKPYLVFIHGCLDEWAFKYHGFKKYPYWYLIEKQNFLRSSGVLALSRDEEAQINAKGIHKPVSIIRNQLVFPLPRVPEPERILPTRWLELINKPYVLFMSRLHPKKGLDLLLDAWKQVQTHYPDWRLVIAGSDEGGYKEKLIKKVELYNLGKSVIFTGFITGDMKTVFLQRASLFVLPSYSEGVPGAVIEALGYGLPVLITPGCHLPEVSESGSGIVIPTNVNAWVENLRRLLDDNVLREHMGSQAGELAKTMFDSREIANKFLLFCNTITKM